MDILVKKQNYIKNINSCFNNLVYIIIKIIMKCNYYLKSKEILNIFNNLHNSYI